MPLLLQLFSALLCSLYYSLCSFRQTRGSYSAMRRIMPIYLVVEFDTGKLMLLALGTWCELAIVAAHSTLHSLTDNRSSSDRGPSISLAGDPKVAGVVTV
jgi:hypothetical protein